MKFIFIATSILFNLCAYGQNWPKVDTLKIFVGDTSMIEPLLVIADDSVHTYEIKTEVRKDGVYEVFSDRDLKKIIYQTQFLRNNKVGYDIYWYPNGNKFMQFESVETVCIDSIAAENSLTHQITWELLGYRSTKRIGEFKSWHQDGKPKEMGNYILIDKCTSRRIGNWRYWDEKGKMTSTTYDLKDK